MAAAQQGGTLQAARILNVSQPSVSHAISGLEALWGVKLFVRLHAQGLLLTTEGKLRYQQALAVLKQAQDLADSQGQELSGELSIGCFSTLGPMYFPSLMRAYQQQHPGVTIRLHEGDTETLLTRIERDTLDLALIYDTGIFNRVQLHHMSQQSPYVVLPADHRLSKRSKLTVQDLHEEPFILINLKHSREYFLSIFNHENVSPNIVAETGSIEMLRSMVANGHGISILVTRPSHDYSYDGKKLICTPLEGAFSPQKIVLASSGEHRLSFAGRAFLQTAQVFFSP